MKSPRRYQIATLLLVALAPLACAKSKSKKKDDATQAQAPAETVAAPDSPQALVGRIALADLAQSSQLQADFAATRETTASLSSAALAESAFNSGTPLKFSASSDTTLENSASLGGSSSSGSSGGYYGSYGNSYGGCNCGWNFPILRGIAGVVSNVGSLIFGRNDSYGYGQSSYVDDYSYGYSQTSYGSCSNSGNGNGNGNYGYGSYDPSNPPFPFGAGTDYQNPSYVWTPNGPMYNNPNVNPLPTTGVTAGTTYNTGIAGCTPSVYDTSRGWVAQVAPSTPNAPLCNGQTAPTGVGPTTGTTYETGAASCVPASYDGAVWRPTTSTSASAPLCDGNVYSNVTGTGAAVNNQMPSFAPTYTINGTNVTFKYVGSYDSASYRYYVYGL